MFNNDNFEPDPTITTIQMIRRTHLLCVLLGLSTYQSKAQTSYRDCLDATLQKSKDENICHYMRNSRAGDDGLTHVVIEYLSGNTKMTGSYRDSLFLVEQGYFRYYYRNGQLESEGNYENGRKSGLWKRYLFDGTARPDRIYPPQTELKTIEKPASFPTGYDGFSQFITDNIQYPEPALRKGLSANVKASFVITENGQITNIEILESSHYFFDRVVLELLYQMPPWIPAERNGTPTQSTFILPLFFRIEDGYAMIGIND